MSGRRPHRLRLVATAMLAGLAASSTLATTIAQAAPTRFTYELCDAQLPGGGEPQLTFGPDGDATVGPFDTCATPNGSIYLYQLAHSASGSATLDVAIPPTPGGWVETETLSGGSYRLGPGNEHSYVHDEGWPAPNAGEETRTFFEHGGPEGGSGAGSFKVALTCSAAFAPGCEAGGGIYVRYISALEVDPNPPTVATPTGSLLAAGLVRGHQELGATATDLGGGVQDLEVLVNGVRAASPRVATCTVTRISNSSYSGVVATSPSPCPSALAANWSLDTASYPFRQGVNEVQACASDFATQGEADRSCSTPQSIQVDDSCQESEVAAGGASLAVHPASGAGHRRAALPFGRSTPISGTLTDSAGNPVAAATICIEAKIERSPAAPTPIGVATTDGDGRFAYRLAPGPDRQILVGYRHDAFQVSRTLTVRTHAGPTLRVGPRRLRNGGRVRLHGSLPGPEAAGRVVVLQAHVPGTHRWITFRKATTGTHGRFRARYHFISTTRTITYRFRAVVPRQSGYPWAQGASRAARVTVSG